MGFPLESARLADGSVIQGANLRETESLAVTPSAMASRVSSQKLTVDCEPRFDRRTRRWRLAFFNEWGRESLSIEFPNELEGFLFLDALHDALAMGARKIFAPCQVRPRPSPPPVAPPQQPEPPSRKKRYHGRVYWSALNSWSFSVYENLKSRIRQSGRESALLAKAECLLALRLFDPKAEESAIKVEERRSW